MAWTLPATWTYTEIVSVGKMNQQVRDNLLALDQHGHGGAAGDGAALLAALARVDFANQGSAPASAGRLQRDGADLYYHDGVGVVKVTNHAHTPIKHSQFTVGWGVLDSNTDMTARGTICTLANTDYQVFSQSWTPGAANRSLICSAGFVGQKTSAGNLQAKIFFDDVEKLMYQTGGGYIDPTITLVWLEPNPSIAAHTFKTKVRSSVGGDIIGVSRLDILEVKV